MKLFGIWVGVVGAAGLAGCAMDPAAPLIPTPTRAATVLPVDAPQQSADGFPNVLADPASVAGLPRNPLDVEADERRLAAAARRADSETAGIGGASFADELVRRGRTHVEEARRAIEATGQPQPASPSAAPSPATPADAAQQDPGRPIDPDAPSPRTVGNVPPPLQPRSE